MHNVVKKSVWLLIIACLLLGTVMPVMPVTAATESTVYDFYTPYKEYAFLYHWRVVDNDDYFDTATELVKDTKVATDKINAEYASGLTNWNIERFSGYATVSAKGYIEFNVSQNGYHVLRIKSPGTGNYEMDIHYTATSKSTANPAAEFMIIPAENKSYTAEELAALIAQYRAPLRISCYDAKSSYKAKTATLSCSLLEGEEYFFVIGGGSKGGTAYVHDLTARRVGEYDPPKAPEYPRPVTIMEEALTRWRDDCSCVAEVNGYDYLALPINGGKMYIYNLDTWQLVDEVTLGVNIPRGITVDDNGVFYVVGDSYYIDTYDLKTNKTGKSSRFTVNGVTAGSAYDVDYGDDGNLYFGTNKGHIIRYDPRTDTSTPLFVKDYGISNATYVSSVIQKGQYIYAAVTTSTSKHYLLKLDKDTLRLIGTCDYTSTGLSSYLSNMSIIPGGSPAGGDIIMGNTGSLMAIDTATMTLMTPEAFGVSTSITGYVSEEIDGKYYYVSGAKRDVYVFDMQTKKAAKSDHIGVVTQGFSSCGKTVTLNFDGVTDQYLYGFTDAQHAIYFTNLRTGQCYATRDLVDANAGAGSGVNSLTAGPAGSNVLYYGGFLSDVVLEYNIQLGTVTNRIAVSGIQTDAICIYNGQIYTGNYTEGQLTRLHPDTNKPEVLMTLHNSLFSQSRIHAIVGGDDKIFFGTFPYVYQHGGVIAWYDLQTNRSYVAVGQNPEDVYYANYADTQYDYAGKKPVVPVENVKWYNEVTGEQVTAFDNWTGIVDYQSIKDVAYHNGILYAATSITGGTNSNPVSGTSAVIIAYDVAARKVIATFDPAQYGFTSPVPMISGIEVDEQGNLWCVASETLFMLTLNSDHTWNYAELLSFDKIGYDGSQGRNNSDIRFHNGYVYVAFERLGSLCKINMTKPSDYTLLLPNVTANDQVPESFVIGEDGNLYYLQGAALKMLTIDPTEDEWKAAAVVTEQISAITPDTVTQTRQAYENLTLRQKSLVQNYSELVQAEADILMAEISLLGDISWEDYDQVHALLAIYKAMPQSQQKLVTNYYKLVNANQTLQLMEKNAPVVITNSAQKQAYYQTLEAALAATTAGTIHLREDIAAGTVILKSGITLDLNGYTLTADYLVAMKGAAVVDGGAACTGGGSLKIKKENLALAQNNGDGVIAVWNGTDGYLFTRVTFQQIAKPVSAGAAQYIFLPGMSNPAAAALLADGGLDNGLKIQVSLTWNDGQSQQFYTYSDELVQKVFDGTGRWVFDLKITGIAGITDMVANPVVVTDCGAQATAAATVIEEEGYR